MSTHKTIKVTPEQKAKALRDAARNSKVKVVRSTLERLVQDAARSAGQQRD